MSAAATRFGAGAAAPKPAPEPAAAAAGARGTARSGAALELRGISKRFGIGAGGYLALADIDLDVAPGEFLCLLGPSGCGKSTLLNIVAGFLPPSSGTARYGGVPITRPDPRRMMLFQDSSLALFPWLTAEDNVAFGLRLQRIPARERRAIVQRHLDAVGLGDRGKRFPHEMSGGMRQRLQIARSLATEPEMLLMDEPFGALDAITRQHMHRMLLELWQGSGRSVLFVTHDISEAMLLADRIAVMSIGPGSHIREILDLHGSPRPRDPTDAGFQGAYRRIEALLDADPHIADVL